VSSLAYNHIVEELGATPLFDDKDWKYSPEPFYLSSNQVVELEQIGSASLDFYLALNALYNKASEDRDLLRNGGLRANWVVDYLDIGKPDSLLQHVRCKKIRSQLPPVIRPDLLITDEGFALTELDSVPGGIGLTAFLYGLYANFPTLVGSKEAMLDQFLVSVVKNRGDSSVSIALVVSDEGATYRPEMEWLAKQLQEKCQIRVLHPNDLDELDLEHLTIYRFWELFDLPNLPTIRSILDRVGVGEIRVTPPMKPHLEEKMGLALYHHPRLAEYWQEAIGKKSRRVLDKIIPKSWIIDPTPVPVNGILLGPEVDGRPMSSWDELKQASKKDRNLIIKRSGFSEDSWGARSVTLGNDVPLEEWSEKLDNAQKEFSSSPYIIQEFKKPMNTQHPIYKESGEVEIRMGRTRICPYYFVSENQARLSGVLATFCPSDKKIIHGMTDAALLPCALRG
jgi:hypothetical protein